MGEFDITFLDPVLGINQLHSASISYAEFRVLRREWAKKYRRRSGYKTVIRQWDFIARQVMVDNGILLRDAEELIADGLYTVDFNGGPVQTH